MTAFNYTHTHTNAHSLVAQECPGSVVPSANRETDKVTKIKGAQYDYVLDNCELAALMWHRPNYQTHAQIQRPALCGATINVLQIYCRDFLAPSSLL